MGIGLGLLNIKQSSINSLLNYEFLNGNLWDFYFIDNSDIRFLVQEVNLPFMQINTETLNTGEKVVKGFTPEEEVSITFIETADFDVYNYMQKWLNNIYDKKNRVFRTGKAYVKTGILSYQKPSALNLVTNILSVKASYEATKAFKYQNLMIKSIGEISNTYTETDYKTLTVTFSVESIDEL